MTAPPPDRPGGDGDRPAGDRDVDASFAAIVSGWEGPTPHWPEHAEQRAEPPAQPPSAPPDPAAPPPPAAPAAPDVAEEDLDGAGDDEGHYEPPEPPPVPRLAEPTVGALGLIALGALLLLAPGVVGLGSGVGFPLGLIALTGGLGWLLLRLRKDPDPDSGWDDGAQL